MTTQQTQLMLAECVATAIKGKKALVLCSTIAQAHRLWMEASNLTTDWATRSGCCGRFALDFKSGGRIEIRAVTSLTKPCIEHYSQVVEYNE